MADMKDRIRAEIRGQLENLTPKQREQAMRAASAADRCERAAEPVSPTEDRPERSTLTSEEKKARLLEDPEWKRFYDEMTPEQRRAVDSVQPWERVPAAPSRAEKIAEYAALTQTLASAPLGSPLLFATDDASQRAWQSLREAMQARARELAQQLWGRDPVATQQTASPSSQDTHPASWAETFAKLNPKDVVP